MTTLTEYFSATVLAASVPAGDLVQLLDDPHTPTGEVNEDFRDALIARVNGEIASALPLPLQVVDADAARVQAVIHGYAVDLFLYYAKSDRNALDDAIKDRFKNAQAWLDKLASNKRTLGAVVTPSVENRQSVGSSETTGRVFTKANMAGF
ncbi:MAG: DUF1320 family protein [Verrucomicrobia bacterium]|nr:DUF1320 family protein [Verrucomicrobiota bacterium]